MVRKREPAPALLDPPLEIVERSRGSVFGAGDIPDEVRKELEKYPSSIRSGESPRRLVADLFPIAAKHYAASGSLEALMKTTCQSTVEMLFDRGCGHGAFPKQVCHFFNVKKGSLASCPECLKNKKVQNSLYFQRPDLMKEWHFSDNRKKGLLPWELAAKSNKSAKWFHLRCGQSYVAAISNRVDKKSGCPNCNLQRSRAEVALACELEALGFEIKCGHKFHSDRKFRADIFINRGTRFPIVVEYDGSRYHKDNSLRDKERVECALGKGYSVIRLREYGLCREFDFDVMLPKKASDLEVTKACLRQLRCHINSDEILERVDSYLRGSERLAVVAANKAISEMGGPCPFGQSLLGMAISPKASEDFNNARELNGILADEIEGKSVRKAYFRCTRPGCGKVYEKSPSHASRSKEPCPYCSNYAVDPEINSIKKKDPRLYSAVKSASDRGYNAGLDLKFLHKGMTIRVDFVCWNCGNLCRQHVLRDISRGKSKCPKCSRRGFSEVPEKLSALYRGSLAASELSVGSRARVEWQCSSILDEFADCKSPECQGEVSRMIKSVVRRFNENASFPTCDACHKRRLPQNRKGYKRGAHR